MSPFLYFHVFADLAPRRRTHIRIPASQVSTLASEVVDGFDEPYAMNRGRWKTEGNWTTSAGTVSAEGPARLYALRAGPTWNDVEFSVRFRTTPASTATDVGRLFLITDPGDATEVRLNGATADIRRGAVVLGSGPAVFAPSQYVEYTVRNKINRAAGVADISVRNGSGAVVASARVPARPAGGVGIRVGANCVVDVDRIRIRPLKAGEAP